MTPKQFSQRGFKDKAWLYSFVFFGRWSLLVTFFLVLSFLVQPVDQALANAEEPAPVADDVAPQEDEEEGAESVSEVEEESDNEEAVFADNEPEDTDALVETSDEDLFDLATPGATSTEETSPDSTDTTDETVATSTESTDSTATTTPITEEEDFSAPTPVLIDDNDDEAPKTLEEIQQELEAELAEEVEPVVQGEAGVVVTDENFFQFDRQSCVAIGNGSYHCTVEDAPSLNESTVVYADRGENGSMQIFLRTANGGVQQLTDDPYDNSSPHFNAEAREIVWQRLIDGRYQIVLYDIDEAEERQLTFSRTNNMEPKVSVDGIVWQAWDGNDWEIMYFDGRYTDQITDNTLQDVAPAIEDRYILWSVLGTEQSEAKVYSLDNQETLTITGQEGGTIANPRFVLVYDTRFENGDIITQGFDPVTGESSPLGATPAPEPIDIPDVDPLGEVRALINNKVQDEDEFDELLIPETDTATNTLNLLPTASSTDGTLDLSIGGEDLDLGEEIVDQPAATTTEEFELTDFDLVIPTSTPVFTEEEPEPELLISTSTEEIAVIEDEEEITEDLPITEE